MVQCPTNAKHIRDDLTKAKQLLTQKEKVIVSLAPSFASEFSDYSPEKIVFALKQLGFWGVSETALGADIVSRRMAQDLLEAEKLEQKLYLSSACPVTVEYIKKYKQEFAPYITKNASPLLAHSRYLRQIYGDEIGVVFIGPCIAKKRESDVWKSIDVVLTFDDLRRWFSEYPTLLKNEIVIPAGKETEFIPQKAAKGVLYPVDGGMIDSIKKYDKLKNVRTIAITGIDQIANALQGLNPKNLKEPFFIEMLACAGGCINGPGVVKGKSTALKRVRLLDYAEKTSDTIDLQCVFDINGVLPVENSEEKEHSIEEIRNALRSVGKYTLQDELNCASCGYDTCRSFAEAILNKHAEKSMCVSYMRKLAQNKANGLIKAIPSGVVVVDKKMKIIECNQNFAKLLGSDVEEMYDALPGLVGARLDKMAKFSKYLCDVLLPDSPEVIDREVREGKKIFHITAFVIEKEEFAAAVIEDVTSPQIQKKRIVSQAKKVINKSLTAVQKIAFLLGENAAETELILNSIIDSFETEDKED